LKSPTTSGSNTNSIIKISNKQNLESKYLQEVIGNSKEDLERNYITQVKKLTFDNATLRQVSTEQRKTISRLKCSLEKEHSRNNNSTGLSTMLDNQMLKNKIEA